MDIAGIIAGCSMPVVIVGLALYFRYRRERLAHETMRVMVEKGVPITPELIQQLGKRRSRRLLPGLVLIGIGGAMLISNHSWSTGFQGPPGGGLILLFIGLAFLIVWLVERNKDDV